MARSKLTPRKQPTQERARATVDAILQATAYILVKKGWTDLTTNAVAERAGVNIASLYQYFPNKLALVVELQRRHIAEARAAAREHAQAQPGEGWRDGLRRGVQASLAFHARAPALHRVFSDELPRSARVTDDEEVFELWRTACGALLADVDDPDRTIWILKTVLHALVHQATAERPDDLEDPAFVDEITAVLEAYLARVLRRGQHSRQRSRQR